MSRHTIVVSTNPDKHPIEELLHILNALTGVEVLQSHDEHMLEQGVEERAKERATCSVCLARTYRGNEDCVCEDGGDAEDYDEALADEQGREMERLRSR